MLSEKLEVSEDAIQSFCEKWNIVQIDVFGSAIRSDFRDDSDIDLLIVYAEEAKPTLFDEGQMLEELEALFGRPVHFMTRRAVEQSANPIRKNAILESAVPLYVRSA